MRRDAAILCLKIRGTAQALHSGRNNIHLYGAMEQGGDFYALLQSETQSLTEADQVLAELKELQSQ
jgi:hypothetical protein